MSFNLESYIEAIKLELAKYKVGEIKNVCKAFNQRERIYITGKSKQQLIDEIADRLEFLLKTDYKRVPRPGVQRKARAAKAESASAEVSEEEDDEEISDETNRLLEQLGQMKRPDLRIKELENLKRELDDMAIRLKFGEGKKKKARRARYKGKGLGDDLLNAAMPYLSRGVDTIINTTKEGLNQTIGKLPGMNLLNLI